ncbi:hypothetical protein BRADI_3g18618v3 [Brachypodium distachyon]|uniref:Myb-like domain-containing protein n=1 Tax=Brachypodium distachyon TaxID=15368 RepID=A0A2K2CY43_BRADI|nr:hypothetical protein BRADI_3g18618v3 [Brachypodium distachyon]
MDEDQSFLDMLSFGASQQLPCSPLGEQEVPATQECSATVKAKSTKGKNWSSDEDKVLIQAWAHTSLDALIGTDQQSSSYWGRISDYYNEHKNSSWPERNPNAINCRWNTIREQTNKFCGCCQQIINRNCSGQTVDQKKKQKKTSDAIPGITCTDDDIRAHTDDLETEKRPLGTKREKERRRKGKAFASDGDGCKLSLETVWSQKLEKDEIKEATKTARCARAFELQKRHIALQERRNENNLNWKKKSCPWTLVLRVLDKNNSTKTSRMRSLLATTQQVNFVIN